MASYSYTSYVTIATSYSNVYTCIYAFIYVYCMSCKLSFIWLNTSKVSIDIHVINSIPIMHMGRSKTLTSYIDQLSMQLHVVRVAYSP